MILSFSSENRAKNAEVLIADIFEANGWDVDRSPEYGSKSPDLIIRRGAQCYVVEVKALSEGRADRVIPILSQAILQSQAYSQDAKNARPLAVVSVENASRALVKQFGAFAEKYAPNIAVGLVSQSGLRYFRGAGLEELNAEPSELQWYGNSPSNQPVNLFSDLNQWMLKVLLAPEIPEHLLQAPRQKYQNGSELAEAAKVSPMSASRFVQQLRNEGYLDDSSRYLALVRRQELFQR